MPLALPSSPLFLAWTWIASLDIIDAFILVYHTPTHNIIFHMLFVWRFSVFCPSL
jgi:hypothetical protein